MIAEHPDATLREIAQVAGISIATAQDGRRQVLSGLDPVPDRLKSVEEEASQRRGSIRTAPPTGSTSAGWSTHCGVTRRFASPIPDVCWSDGWTPGR